MLESKRVDHVLSTVLKTSMFITIDLPPRPRKATALMRALGLLFLVAVVVATLYPMSNWALRAQGPFDFLGRGLPRFWTWFDVLSNVLAYLVLGLLLALGWMVGLRIAATVLVVTLACGVMSLVLESMQSFLPGRVPSLLDWIANTSGGLIGGWIGALLNRPSRPSDRIALPAVPRWYEQGPPSGWLLLLVWLAIQLVPQRLLFACGQLRPAAQWLMDSLSGSDASELSRWVDRLWAGPTPAASGVAIEAAVVVCAVCVSGSLIFALVRSTRQRLAVLAIAACCAFGLRSIAMQGLYGATDPLAWLTPGAQGGLVVGAALLYALETLSDRSRAVLAIALAGLSLMLVNLAPDDRYFESTLQSARAGQLINLHGVLSGVAMVWPLAAIAWFWGRTRTRRPGGR
jgi:VanZ family protein